MGFHNGRLWVLTKVEIGMVEIGVVEISGWGDRWSYGGCGVVIGMGVNGLFFFFFFLSCFPDLG